MLVSGGSPDRTDVLAALTHFFSIGHHYAGFVVVEACVIPAVTGTLG